MTPSTVLVLNYFRVASNMLMTSLVLVIVYRQRNTFRFSLRVKRLSIVRHLLKTRVRWSYKTQRTMYLLCISIPTNLRQLVAESFEKYFRTN